ncbi:uncharacterized protein F4812DRAFT_469830 [Daldinia caldariorum]|uniref:uncharacterized protein n=1 Tax=Daldinia caldariorum TaxID=326644 RepID=UPI002007D150|nr:uncharacterized protein F4812DRAFT_469830 [Daldinia caldariorum]KAI1469743.1 hypothetical protein F4812DRAFT_469830 [Daldinia caldariorum]
MGDPLGAVGSIVGIAAFGLKFATTLQTYIEAVSEARESLRDIASDVSATASALEQLHEFIRPDQGAIIHLIAKVVGVEKGENGKVTLDALDLHSFNIASRIRTFIWPFQQPRIRRHQEDLRWLKLSLLFHLRLMELARTKMMFDSGQITQRHMLKRWHHEGSEGGREKSEGDPWLGLLPQVLQMKHGPEGQASSKNNVFAKLPIPIKYAHHPVWRRIVEWTLAVNPKSSESLHTTQDTRAAPVESPGSSVNKDKKLSDNTEHPGPKERHKQDTDHNALNAASTASPAQINVQSSPENAGSSQRRKKPIHGWKSQELEAYLFESDSNIIRKLHFSHEALTDELRRVTKSRGYDVWSQYASLSSAQWEAVGRVTAEANHSSHHSRTCVAINQQFWSGQSCILVIFLLGPLVDPVYVKSGPHHLKFGFELCRTWEGIYGLIRQTLQEMGVSVPVSYNLHDLDDQIILCTMWRNTVRPGLVVFVQIPGPPSMPPVPNTGRLPLGTLRHWPA